MARATAKRISELLIADLAPGETFDVDFMDGKFTDALIEALVGLGCEVQHHGPNSRLYLRKLPTGEVGYITGKAHCSIISD